MADRPTYYQDRYLYSSLWPKDATIFLMDGLINEKNVGNWIWNGQNTNAIMSMKERLNSHFNCNYDYGSVRARIRFMRCRYRIFQALVQRSDVQWDEEENVVYASPVTWDEMRQEYPLTNAYIYQGDLLYNSLKILFKPAGDISDEEPDDIPAIIDANQNVNNPGPSQPSTTNPHQPSLPNRMIRRNTVILNFHSDDSDSSTSS